MVNRPPTDAGTFSRIVAGARIWPGRAARWMDYSATAWMWGAMPICLAVWMQAKQKLPKRALEEIGSSMIAAMAGLIILLAVLILLVWLGGRFARHYMEDSGPALPSISWGSRQDDWADRPLPDEGEKSDEVK